MKLYEDTDYILLPDGKTLEIESDGAYPFFYLDDKVFVIGNEGETHIDLISEHFPGEELTEEFVYRILGNATYTGRVWINDNMMAYWDLDKGADSRKRLKEIVNNLEEELEIKIDTTKWWLEFSDTTTGIPYFIKLNDYIENNDLKYGIKDEEDKVSVEVKKAWHLLNSMEKQKLKKEYGMDKFKVKARPLAWKQALLKSESIRDKMSAKSEEEIRKNIEDYTPTDKIREGIHRNQEWLMEEGLSEMEIAMTDGKDPIMAEMYKINYSTFLASIIDGGFLKLFKKFVSYDIDGLRIEHMDNAWNNINKVFYDTTMTDDVAKKLRQEYREIADILYHDPRMQKLMDRKQRKYYKTVMKENKSILSFKDFLNESLRDKMTPKSDEDIDIAYNRTTSDDEKRSEKGYTKKQAIEIINKYSDELNVSFHHWGNRKTGAKINAWEIPGKIRITLSCTNDIYYFDFWDDRTLSKKRIKNIFNEFPYSRGADYMFSKVFYRKKYVLNFLTECGIDVNKIIWEII